MRGPDRSYQVHATSSRDEFAALDARRELEQDEAIADKSVGHVVVTLEQDEAIADKSVGHVIVTLSLSDVKQIKHHVVHSDGKHSWAVTNGKLVGDQITVYLTGTVADLATFAGRALDAALRSGD